MEAIQILKELINIKSITRNENDIVDYIVDKIKGKLNFIVERNSIVAFSNCNNFLAFVGHIDTVDNINEKNGLIEGDKIYGLGASDMKAGIAVMISLIQYFYNLPIIWIFYDREEGYFMENGLEIIFKKYLSLLSKVKFAIILEPTSNNVELGCNGVINYGLWIKGKSGHSSRKNTYINPFYKSLPILEYFKNYQAYNFSQIIEFENKKYELNYYSNAVITTIEGYNDFGAKSNFRNVVPEYCYMNLNVRFTPDKSFNSVDRDFREILDRFEIDRIDLIDSAPSGKIILNNELRRFLSWYLSNGDFCILPKQAWTDVARFTMYDIPAINLGPGEPNQAHQKNEYALLSKVIQLHEILFKYLSEFSI